jgi:hypothetical protein
MASEIESVREQLLAAQGERDACARNAHELQLQLAASRTAMNELEGKCHTFKSEIERQARQLLDQTAASDAAAADAASLRSRLQAELQASQNSLSDSQQALLQLQSERQREREVTASSLAAAEIRSNDLLKQVLGLETRLSEVEHEKCLLEQRVVEGPHDESPFSPKKSGGHTIGSVVVELPERHGKRNDSLLPPRTRRATTDSPSSSSPTKDFPLTPSVSDLVSSANLPPREAGLSRTRSRTGSDNSEASVGLVTQVRVPCFQRAGSLRRAT